jgi:hypothetical protein
MSWHFTNIRKNGDMANIQYYFNFGYKHYIVNVKKISPDYSTYVYIIHHNEIILLSSPKDKTIYCGKIPLDFPEHQKEVSDEECNQIIAFIDRIETLNAFQ